MKELKIAICDDETEERLIIKKMILEISKKNIFFLNITEFFSGEKLLEKFNKDKNEFDIIFLDIKMSGMTGLKVAQKIRNINDEVIIIFITGFKNYVFNAFEVAVFRYILKPLEKEKMEKALLAVFNLINKKTKQEEKFLVIKCNKKKECIAYNSIIYFEKVKNKIKIVTENNVIKYYNTFKQLKIMLQENDFIQIHQGYIVNISYIEKIKNNQLILKNFKSLPISKRRLNNVRKQFFTRIKE